MHIAHRIDILASWHSGTVGRLVLPIKALCQTLIEHYHVCQMSGCDRQGRVGILKSYFKITTTRGKHEAPRALFCASPDIKATLSQTHQQLAVPPRD